MARLVLLLALCVLPAIVAASRQLGQVAEYDLEGRVYCDTCRCGYETSATKYIHGAKVKLECFLRKAMDEAGGALVYEAYGETDKTGTYVIHVKGDQKDNVCEVKLFSSPVDGCNKVDPGRDRSRVILNSYSGITDSKRHANALGFMQDNIMSGCTQVLQQYQESEE